MKTNGLFLIIALTALLMSLQSTAFSIIGDKSNDKKAVRVMNRSIKEQEKDLEKEGFSVEPGAPGMSFQIRRSIEKQDATDGQGENLYLIGIGVAKSGVQNAARRHAFSDAAIDAGTLLETKLFGLIETDYINKQYTRDEYDALSRQKGVFSNLIAKRLPPGNPVCILVKDDGKLYEYQVRVAYSYAALNTEATKAMSDLMDKDMDKLREKFERLSGLDKLGNE